MEFHWGTLHSFKAVVERLSLRFTYFSSSGMPLRAKADLSFKQWTDEEVQPLQNPTSHASSMHSVHTLMTGETLDRIAARYYRDPTRWRLIADANGIVDPLDAAGRIADLHSRSSGARPWLRTGSTPPC